MSNSITHISNGEDSPGAKVSMSANELSTTSTLSDASYPMKVTWMKSALSPPVFFTAPRTVKPPYFPGAMETPDTLNDL